MIISLLQDLESESISRGIPILGRDKGSWLLNKVKEIKPKLILELGTANGYSGSILGSEGAELITVEINPEIAEEAEKNFSRFNINASIIIGDGVKEVEKLVKEKQDYFDLIFIDFAKNDYIKVLENCIKLVKNNGFIIADNITFDGCQDFKEAVLNHPKLKTEIIKIKDWLSCSEKF